MNTDEDYIRKCIELGEEAAKKGDFPFGAVIANSDGVLSERHNESFSKKQVCYHAEMLAMLDAQHALGTNDLSKYTLYSSVEPCAMCSFAIQETKIRRVVFGLRSPIMGGYSRWGILQDELINETFPNGFYKAPQIEAGVLSHEIALSWENWNKEVWDTFCEKGVFVKN